MKAIALNICFLTAVTAFGQGSFQVVYPNHSGTAYAQQAPDGNYVVAFNRDSTLFKIDSTAQHIWSKSVHMGIGNFKIDNRGRIWCGAEIPGAFAQDVLMCLLDSVGDSLWTRRFFTEYSGAYVIEEKLNSSGTCYFILIDDVPGLTNSYYMFNINENGDSLEYYSHAQSDFSFTNGGRLINLSTNIYTQTIYVSLTDTVGNLFWQTKIEDTLFSNGTDAFTGNKIIQCSDGSLLVAGNVDSIPVSQMEAVLFRIDQNTGDTLYSRSYGSGDFIEIIQCTNGGFAGIIRQPFMKLYLLDSALNVLSIHDYSGLGGSEASSLQECSDHGFLIGGYTNTYPYIIKTDSFGNAPPVVMTSISEEGQKQVGIFPNPFSTTARLNVKLDEDTPVAIYDCRGQVVDVQMLSRTSPAIKGEKLSSGLYFFRLMSDKPLTGKMVKE